MFWDSRFGIPGTHGEINTIAVSGRDMYIGGAFSTVDDLKVNQIARWDGVSWFPLGEGLHGVVNTIAIAGRNVWAGGGFGIMKWDGHAWTSPGGGVGGTINAITISGNDVFAGGTFSTAGGQPANNIARWDGMKWHALGSGLSGSATSIVVRGSQLIVGGGFSIAGDGPANHIATWDGTAWSPLDELSLDGAIKTMVADGNDLYVGGTFEKAGQVEAKGLAKWDGNQWSSVGGFNSLEVTGLALFQDELYVVGRPISVDGDPLGSIAKWSGEEWSEPGIGFGPIVTLFSTISLAASSTKLFVAGRFETTGHQIPMMAEWNGNNWSFLGRKAVHGLTRKSFASSEVAALAYRGGKLYAGGTFDFGGRVAANNAAVWEGGRWSALGSGLDRPVRAIGVTPNGVYFGGDFIQAGGMSIPYLARWDGKEWSPVGIGPNNLVFAIAVDGNDVYVGGVFNQAGGQEVNFIAKWNGSTWSSLGSGVDGFVHSIAVSEGKVYVGGSFTNAGGVPAKHIAKWDGTGWSALGDGLEALSIASILVRGTDVFAGGIITQAGQAPASGLALWDGSKWTSFGNFQTACCTATVFALASSGSDLYVGGNFRSVDGLSANQVARWDGSSWNTLGSGTRLGLDFAEPVRSIAIAGSDVFIGGDFLEVGGGKPSSSIARWNNCSTDILPANEAFLAAGGIGSFSRMHTAPCDSPAESDADWIEISEENNGLVSYTVAPNPTQDRRVGTITVASKSFTVFQAADFLDVPSSHPFYAEISKLAARGITLGCGHFRYCPDHPVSRAEMAPLIIRALGEFSPPNPIQQRFSDVSPENIFYDFIEEMAVRQITLGCGDGIYCPAALTTREQMAAFIVRALGELNPAPPAQQVFGDVPPGNPFYAFIGRLFDLGITTGCGGGNFCPDSPVTRGQLAAFLVRAFDL
jgi:hypothetical protein